MSGQDPPQYEIRYSPAADDAIAVLPQPARRALSRVLRQLESDPMTAGTPYHPRWPPEFRTMPFSDSGLLTYVVLERRRQVVIEHITWIG